MQWLSENWIWIVFAIGMVLLMRHGRVGHGHSHGSGHHSSHNDGADRHMDTESRPNRKSRSRSAVLSPNFTSATLYAEK